MTEQTVGNVAEAPVTPAAEVPTAQDTGSDLTALLKEFETATKPSPQPEPQKPAVDDSKITALEQQVQSLRSIVSQADMTKALTTIRGDADADVFTDAMINGWIAALPNAQKIAEIWESRGSNPAGVEKLLNSLKAEFAKGPLAKFKKRPDPDVTEDVNAVAAAVRGARNTPPPDKPPNFAGMSNAEYRRAVKEQYGYDPGV